MNTKDFIKACTDDMEEKSYQNLDNDKNIKIQKIWMKSKIRIGPSSMINESGKISGTFFRTKNTFL